jgi:hypothetical protein
MADLYCNVPIELTDTDLLYTDVTEDDYAVWNSGTTYAAGDRVIRTTSTTHKVYESLQGSNLNKTPESEPTWWIEVAATNRWRCLDQTLFQRTTVSGTMRYYWALPDPVTAVSLHDVEGGDVYVGLIETSSPGARINLITFSEIFDNVFFTLTGAVFNPTKQRAPWSAFTAQAMREDTSTGPHLIQGGNVSYTSGLAYTFSCYVKRGNSGSRNCQLAFPTAAFSGQPRVNFNLGTGAVTSALDGATGAITDEGNGWYRCAVTATADATISANAGEVRIANGTTTSYTGDGASNIFFIGWQTEQASSASTYQFIATALLYGVRTFSGSQVMDVVGSGDLTDAVFTGIPGSAGDVLEIAIYADSGNAKLGEMAAGTSYSLGTVVNFGRGTQRNLSRKDFDVDFGTLTIVRRAGRKERTFNLKVPRDEMNATDRFLAYVEATPCSYYIDGDTANAWGLLVYGVLQDWSFEVPPHDTIIFPVTIDGIV